jgi:hypothetical protein
MSDSSSFAIRARSSSAFFGSPAGSASNRFLMIAIRPSTSWENRVVEMLTAFRLVRSAIDFGNDSAAGMVAPSTSTGITRMSRERAATSSNLTKSLGRKIRLENPFRASSHRGPITARKTRQLLNRSAMTLTKSTPPSIPSMSMKTVLPSKLRFNRSANLPAGISLSTRR